LPYCGAQTERELTAILHGDFARLHAVVPRGTIPSRNGSISLRKRPRARRDPLAKKSMTAAASTHLIIADDHPLFRDALRQAVASVVTSAKIDEAGSFEELTALLEQDSDVDLVRIDIFARTVSRHSRGDRVRQ
jgi:hypothetical protein